MMGKYRAAALLLVLSLLCGSAANAASFQGADAPGLRDYQSRFLNFTQVRRSGAENQRLMQAARAQLGRSGASLGYSEHWCADFIMDLSHMLDLPETIIPWDYPDGAVVQNLRKKLQKDCGAGVVEPRGAKPGDIIFFDWDGDGWSDHAALVQWYDEKRDELIVLGGNQGSGTLYQRTVTGEFWKAESGSIQQILRPKYRTRDDSEPVHSVHGDVTVIGNGTVDNKPAYLTGERVTLTAAPKPGNVFLGWYEAGTKVSTDPVYQLTVRDHLDLTAEFAVCHTITAEASRSGSASGGGTFLAGEQVTLTAEPLSEAAFLGWYLPDGTLLTTDREYALAADWDATYCAMFEGDVFYDVKNDSWFKDDALRAAELGIVKGYTPIRFGGDIPLTRAMMVELLSRVERADTASAPVCPFVDVDQQEWYAKAVNWAYAAGVVKGTDAVHFEPEETITREHFMMMAVRYLEKKGYSISPAALPYQDRDQITDREAEELIAKAQGIGLITGYEDGTLAPQQKLCRHEGVTILMRAVRFLEQRGGLTAAGPEPTETEPETATPQPETPEIGSIPETPEQAPEGAETEQLPGISELPSEPIEA